MMQRLALALALLVLGTSTSVSAQMEQQTQQPQQQPQQVPEPPVVYVPVPPQQTLYMPGQPMPRQRRYRERYYEGMQIPPGGEIIQRRKIGLMIPGIAIFGVSYISTISYYAVSNDLGNEPPITLVIPIVGPFASMHHYSSSAGRLALGWAGMMQVAGAAMLVLGAIPRRYVQYYAGTGSEPSWALMPQMSGTQVGLDFGLRF